MTKTNKQQYDVYIDTPGTGLIKAAQVVLLESSGQLSRMGFRYTEMYREHTHAFALDPVQLPLSSKEFNLTCAGGMPGILDDYLPDDWGRKVLAKLAFYRDRKKLDQHSAIDTLSQLSNSRIGAMQWTQPGKKPDYELGCDLKFLASAETAAQSVDAPESFSENVDEMSLLYLANAGSGIGGARPKALLYENNNCYLAKFNRQSRDEFNNAKVELACLTMAKEAGLNVFPARILANINKRDVLLLDRFDVMLDKDNRQTRRHLISINSLLKKPETQRDRGGAFRYDDIADILRMYSIDIETDLTQLLHMMLFNRAINNTDTHERNFSLINSGPGYTMAPAYDMVPSLISGAYPVAGYQYDHTPPPPGKAAMKGKIFGLPRTVVSRVADQVIAAVEHWPEWAHQWGVSDEDINSVEKVITL